MRFFGKTNIDFMGKRWTLYLISAAVIVIGMSSFFFKGVDFGIDFRGGTELHVQFATPVDVGDVRSSLSKAGFPRAEIKTLGRETDIMIRIVEQDVGSHIVDQIKAGLQRSFATTGFEVVEVTKIGPKIGAELRRDALYAVIFSLIAILIYMGFRFKFIYGVGAVVALFHDVLVTLGLISICDGISPFLNLEIDQNMVAAVLTLVGLSVNDTVVIFDRVRENLKIYRSMSFVDVINRSINDTLSRTVITSGTIFLVLLVLFIFGGDVTRGFAFTLLVGITTGTYSSIYIASAIVLDWTKRKEHRTAP